MRASFLSATLAVSAGVSALPKGFPGLPKGIPGLSSGIPGLPKGDRLPGKTIAPALPLSAFDTPKFFTPLSLDQILDRLFETNDTALPGLDDIADGISAGISSIFGAPSPRPSEDTSSTGSTNTPSTQAPSSSDDGEVSIAATCSNPRVRIEWDSYSNSDRQAYIDAIKCLQGKPASGQFSQSRSRYEDLVSLHQNLTPNVHGNHKFLIWHRYYMWTFEDILRTECGFDRNLPWFDETRYAGKFSQSSIFSSQWYGGISLGGRCVTDGQFANLAISVGPGEASKNTPDRPHCLARNGDGAKTANCNSAVVNGCNNESRFSNMATCAERGAHAWGHNGVGAVMQDTFASPADPFFWLHHGFIDRNFRVWQNADASRKTTVDGTGADGRPLTMDTNVNVAGLRPDVRIGDIMDTMSDKLCYKYSY